MFFIFLGNALAYSEILSLLAISSLIVFVSDTSFLNPVMFPSWKAKQKVEVNFSLLHILIALIISSFFFLFNEITIQNSQTLVVRIICAIIWIPLIFHGIGYSFLIYTKKLINYSLLITGISLIYTLCFWFLKDFSAEGYIYSRLISIIFGLIIVLSIMINKFNLSFSFNLPTSNVLKPVLINFLNVNNVIISTFLIRVIYSQIFKEDLAIFNYSLVIIFIFQSLVNKNLNSLSMIDNMTPLKSLLKVQKNYLLIFSSLIFVSAFLLFYNSIFPEVLFSKLELIQKIFVHSFLLTPVLFLCGRQDLINSDKMLSDEKNKLEKTNFSVIFISVTFFFIFILVAKYILL